MESVTNAVEQTEKELSDIGSSVRGVDEDAGGVIAAIDSSACDSVPVTEATGVVTSEMVVSPEPHANEEGKEFKAIVGLETELQDQNEPPSNSIDSENVGDATKESELAAEDPGEEPRVQSVGGLEQPETNCNVDSKTELKVETSLETELAISDAASPITPAGDISIIAPISPTVDTDDNVIENAPTQQESEVLLPPKKGFRFRINKNKVSVEPPAEVPEVFNQQKRVLRSKKISRSCSMALSSLPIDSLHSIASFLKPLEWRSFGQCNKATNKICKEIFRRVRMHGFRCATEVVTAWKFGQFADAKELCALYVSAGVPIYPHCLGHSYHTLVWRLGIEAKHLQEEKKEGENTKNASPLNKDSFPVDPSSLNLGLVDPFYNERDDLRRGELAEVFGESEFTYLEEKSLHALNKNKSKSDMFTRTHRRRTSIDQTQRAARNVLAEGLRHPIQAPLPPPFPFEAPAALLPRSSWASTNGTSRRDAYRRAARSRSFSGNHYRAPNVSVKIHRHLLDQHLLGRRAINDFEGTLTPPTVSLSADFFHPFFSFRSPEEPWRNHKAGNLEFGVPAYHQLPVVQQMENERENVGDQRGASRIRSRRSNSMEDTDSDGEAEAVFSEFVMDPPYVIDVNERMAVMQPTSIMQSTRTAPTSNPNRVASGADVYAFPHQVTAQNAILSSTDLDVYSASSRSQKSDNIDATERKLNNYLNARFTVYHCCLERHLLNNDCEKFDETIMDFWDEFFPQTEDIQYYDCYTAVPRISRIEKFLTKPCPKQIGIVQCEIERVKLNSKKKGVNMKGRFFPTYEYRLFIRHRPSAASPSYDLVDPNDDEVRRDTVLMTAKNRGRKHSDNAVQASKKGSNNYYLSLPQQDDLDLHYMNANGFDDVFENSPNGVGTKVSSSEFSGLLGRLQSNFVGTEFQIFTPRLASKETKSQFFSKSPMVSPHSIASGANSDDEVFYDNGRQREDRPRGRFRRLSLKGRRSNSGDMSAEFSEPFQAKPSPLSLRRSRSGDSTPGGRNRKVSAAESFFESPQFKVESQRTFFEEEDGAITYTANLLGSRPRIMDVCIPKVNSGGTGAEWKRYLENCKDYEDVPSADRLLNHLKLLQQNGQPEDNETPVNPATNDDEEQSGDNEQEYSPPNDYGLLALQNRPPWWNVELGSFVLNFGGRVSVASVKNFQLCDRNEQDHIMLQFGRIEGRHSFTMDFQYPLTAVQAFAIAISSLQSKISFG